MLFIRVFSLDTCVFKHVIFALFPAQTAKPHNAPQLQYMKLMYHCKGCIFNMLYRKLATIHGQKLSKVIFIHPFLKIPKPKLSRRLIDLVTIIISLQCFFVLYTNRLILAVKLQSVKHFQPVE